MSTVKTLNFKVNGLNTYQQYKFNFTNKGGNWPVKVSPLSGIFYPSGLKTYVYFCANTGECPPSDAGVIFNSPSSSFTVPGLSLDKKSLYTILELSVSEIDTNQVLQTYPCIVECDECIPTLSVVVNDINLTATTGPSVSIVSDITGLVPNQVYNYRFQGEGGTWPVAIKPVSGTIISSTDKSTINALVSVCKPGALCNLNDASVLNKSLIDNVISPKYSLVSLSLDAVDPVNSNFQNSAQSSFAVSCKDCFSNLSVGFAESPVLTLNNTNNNCCSGTRLMLINISGLQPYETYNWSISSDSNKIAFSPNAGTIVESNQGSKTIRSFMTTALNRDTPIDMAEYGFSTITLSKVAAANEVVSSPAVKDTILIRCQSAGNCPT